MRHHILATVLLSASTSGLSAGQAEFIDLGTLVQMPGVSVNSDAFDLSADGRTVVGQSIGNVGGAAQEVAFRWHHGNGMSALGHPAGAFWSKAFCISPDGSRVGGSYRLPGSTGELAFTWSSSSGSVPFAPIGQGLALPAPLIAIGDGAEYVVGNSFAAGPIRWTLAGGATVIPSVAGYPIFVPAAASNDGRAVIGTAYSSAGFSRAAIWREGVGTTLLPLLAGWQDGLGTSISGDGETAVGYFIDSTGGSFSSFLWSQVGGLITLGAGLPVDVNGDGTVVVFGGNPARIWTAAGGQQELRTVLTAGGAVVPPLPFAVRAVSEDGRAVAGWVSTPNLGTSRHAFVAFLAPPRPLEVGMTYCSPAAPNSTGQPSEIGARGSIVIADHDFIVRAERLPQSVFGYFLTSRTPGFVANPGGSAGNLCLGGTIGRFSQNVLSSGTAGSFELAVDLGELPLPTGTVGAMPGESWHFQAWHRDGVSSNFTDAVAVQFE